MREMIRKLLAVLAALLALWLLILWGQPLPPGGVDISVAPPVTFPQQEGSALTLMETAEVLPSPWDGLEGLLVRGIALEDLHGALEPGTEVYALLSAERGILDSAAALEMLRADLVPGSRFFLYDEFWQSGAAYDPEGDLLAPDTPVLDADVGDEAWLPLTERDGETRIGLAGLAEILGEEDSPFTEPEFGEDAAGMEAIRSLLLERSDPDYTERMLAEIDAYTHAVEEHYAQTVFRRRLLTALAIIGIGLLLLLRYALKERPEEGNDE